VFESRRHGAIREEHGGCVVFEDRRECSDRGLVACHDGDEAGEVVGMQVEGDAVVHHLATDQRVAHVVSTVELPVRDANGLGGRDQPDREVLATESSAGSSPRNLAVPIPLEVASWVPRHEVANAGMLGSHQVTSSSQA
jgi:hypothetical protein